MRLILEPWYSDNHQVAIIILAESDSTQTHFVQCQCEVSKEGLQFLVLSSQVRLTKKLDMVGDDRFGNNSQNNAMRGT